MTATTEEKTADLREELAGLGFHPVKEKAAASSHKATTPPKAPGRERFVRGSSWVLLGLHPDTPWYTVQAVNKGHVAWFVDFPVSTPREALLAFLKAL